MKRMLLALFLSGAVTGTSASAQAGTIALSATPDGTTCSIIDTTPGTVDVHIVVLDVTDLSAIQFVARKPDCWAGAVWISENFSALLTIGNTQDPVGGLAAAWGQCLDGPVYVGSIRFSTTGAGSTCCPFLITKASADSYPEIPGPIVALCDGPNQFQVAGITADAMINPDPECACLQALGLEESTWGRVKSLYR